MHMRYNADGYPLIHECDSCNHFEPGREVLVPMKECWSCKWSDFRENAQDGEMSICKYPGYKNEMSCNREPVAVM